MNTNKQIGFLNTVYTLSEKKAEKKRDRDMGNIFRELYGFDLRSLKKAA